MKNALVTLCLSAVLYGVCCTKAEQQTFPFVQVEKGMFVRDGKPYKSIGANFWYRDSIYTANQELKQHSF